MKKILKLTMLSAILLSLAGGMASCKEKEKDPENGFFPKPIDVPFTEYIHDCWEFYRLVEDPFPPAVVIIINDEQKLNDYARNITPVDFSKHTLLLVRGRALRLVEDITVSRLQQLSATAYQLDIEIERLPEYPYFQDWNMAILVDKMSDSGTFELSVTETIPTDVSVKNDPLDSIGHDPSASITGKWKLMEVRHFGLFYSLRIIDYSSNYVVYEFKQNGVLTVSGETDGICFYWGHSIGEHSYSIVAENFELEIDDWRSVFNFSSTALAIHDGLGHTTYYLVRIN